MTCSELWRLVSGVLEPAESETEDAKSADSGQNTERYLGALETASRALIPLSILYDPAGTDLRVFPLTGESRFPLPSRFVSAAVYLTGYLLGGNARLYELYSDECEGIKREIPTEITPTVQAYGA